LPDLNIRLHRLLLNREHVDHYKLPRTPIKESERRAGAFESIHGAGAVELDALEALYPGELDRIVREALSHFYSLEAEAQARGLEGELRQAIRLGVATVTSRHAEHIAALAGMNVELLDLQGEDFSSYPNLRSSAHLKPGRSLFSAKAPQRSPLHLELGKGG
jgi:hypothetical protein